MGFRCLRQRRARRGTPAAPGGVLLDAMYLRGPGYATTPSASCGRCSEGAVGCAAEPLPAAETGEAEQGQPSKCASGLCPAPHIWATATRSRAPFFASTLRGAPQKSAKRKSQNLFWCRRRDSNPRQSNTWCVLLPSELQQQKGPRSVVGACPSAGPLPGDSPASGCGVFSGPHGSQRKSRRQRLIPACGFHRYTIPCPEYDIQ